MEQAVVARGVVLAVALTVYLFGCGTLSNSEKTSLGLDLCLVESQSGHKFRPYVMLVGTGDLLASNQVDWVITSIQNDGSTFYQSYPDETFGESGRFNNPYYIYTAYKEIPEKPSSFVGVVDAPLWIGPEIDTELLRDAKSFKIQFSIQYYSSSDQIIDKSFDWSMTSFDQDAVVYPVK